MKLVKAEVPSIVFGSKKKVRKYEKIIKDFIDSEMSSAEVDFSDENCTFGTAYTSLIREIRKSNLHDEVKCVSRKRKLYLVRKKS